MTTRVVITGVDSSGRSCVTKEQPVTLVNAGSEGLGYTLLYATASSPTIASAAGRAADHYDLGVAPGAVSWTVVEYAPAVTFSMHHTDSVDLDTVLAGSIELTLDDGVHQLQTGDCVVVTGIDHAWRAGSDGCRLGVMSIGVMSPR